MTSHMIRHITVCFAFLALLLAAQEADESYNRMRIRVRQKVSPQKWR